MKCSTDSVHTDREEVKEVAEKVDIELKKYSTDKEKSTKEEIQ